jgi:hypothetical protein
MTDKALRIAGLFVAPVIMLIGLWLCLERLEHGKLTGIFSIGPFVAVAGALWFVSDWFANERSTKSKLGRVLINRRRGSMSASPPQASQKRTFPNRCFVPGPDVQGGRSIHNYGGDIVSNGTQFTEILARIDRIC